MALNKEPSGDIRKNRVYVNVIARITSTCRLEPLSFVWSDGHRYEIDRLLDITHTAQLKTGGTAYRYTVRVRGKQRYMYFDPTDFRWFVEVPPERMPSRDDYGA